MLEKPNITKISTASTASTAEKQKDNEPEGDAGVLTPPA
ncbi:MAG: hypothetical protein ACJAYB_000072 [Psychromonas sp.]|jgi:hypothetical protein